MSFGNATKGLVSLGMIGNSILSQMSSPFTQSLVKGGRFLSHVGTFLVYTIAKLIPLIF